LFDGIFCYKLPTDIFIEYNSICINEEDCWLTVEQYMLTSLILALWKKILKS
jgi:hypothetical protein